MKRRTCLGASVAVLARLAVGSGALTLSGCLAGPRGASTRLAGPTMGTTYRVTLVGALSEARVAAVRNTVESALASVDTSMSTYRGDSEIARFNAAKEGGSVGVSQETTLVVAEALAIARLSGGAFDPTVAPLVDAWGFGPPPAAGIPAEEAIAEALTRRAADGIELDARRGVLRKAHHGLALDLSGIAKGHAVDQVATALEEAGFADYLVDIGGELRARGHGPHGEPWRIGVERPEPGPRSVLRVIELDGGAIATSGDYRHYFEHAGQRYSHTIDPRTGRPVAHRLASVSVVDRRAMTADALATAMMVLGPTEGLALARRLEVAALFLVRSDAGLVEHATPAFARRIVG
jgi:FAD:protein FMN transferase